MTIDYNSESRLRAIALNAIREAMLVYNRWDKPFTDDDAARVETIYHILHLVEGRSDYEHEPLISDPEAAVTSSVRKIADLLADVPASDLSTNSVLETSSIAVAMPKAKVAIAK